MSRDAFEISLGDVTDMEATVLARYRDADAGVRLRGLLRGPFCEGAHTLPAEYPFRDLRPGRPGTAEALVTDPCMWSPELPHLYHVEIEARRGEDVVAEYRGTIGLRKNKQSHKGVPPSCLDHE